MDSQEIVVLDKEMPLAPPEPDLPPAVTESPAKPAVTSQQARTDAIASVLAKAYERASTLELTDAEAAKLTAEFPDEAVTTGAGGDSHLLYIQHAFIRERLGSVFRPGQWSLINRRSWFDPETGFMYAECILVIRGCFVGEAIGAQKYIPKNGRMNYSDAVEGAQSEALRRIAGKYLDCGLQVWKKSWCEGWFARKDGRIAGHEEVRASQAQKRQYTIKPEPAPRTTDEPPTTTAEWHDVVVHFGKNIGVRLADLEPKQLRWYQKEWQPRPFRGRVSDEDAALRNALDSSMGAPAKPAAAKEEDDIPWDDLDKLRLELTTLTRDACKGDPNALTGYLIDEGYMADTEKLPELTEAKLKEIIAALKTK